MNKFRIAAALAVAALMGATVATPATAAQQGVGTASSSSTVLDIELLGGVLGLDVLTDSSVSTIDPTQGPRAASTTLIPAAVRSSLADELNYTAPAVEASTQQGKSRSDNTEFVFPAEIAAALTGEINVSDLVAIVDNAGARSALESSLVGVSVGGAIASVDSIANGLSTGARPNKTSASRSFSADSITVLDLGALLGGLGINLADLPISTLIDVLDTLGVSVPGVGGDFKVNKTINELNGAIDDLQAVVNDEVPDLSQDALDLLAELGIPAPNADVKSQVNAAIDDLQDELAGVLNGLLAVLDGATLLGLDGAEVSVAAVAGPGVKVSSANTTAALGAIRVGAIQIPAVDAMASVAEAKAAAQAAVDQINAVLTSVHPSLGALPDVPGLVSISLFDADTSVARNGDYVESLASMALLTVEITPPADLAAIIDGIDAASGAAQQISDVGGTPASVSEAINELGALVGTNALAKGSTVRVGVLSAGADYALLDQVLGAPENEPLAATGGETNLIMIIAAGLGAAAILIRRRLAEARN